MQMMSPLTAFCSFFGVVALFSLYVLPCVLEKSKKARLVNEIATERVYDLNFYALTGLCT